MFIFINCLVFSSATDTTSFLSQVPESVPESQSGPFGNLLNDFSTLIGEAGASSIGPLLETSQDVVSLKTDILVSHSENINEAIQIINKANTEIINEFTNVVQSNENNFNSLLDSFEDPNSNIIQTLETASENFLNDYESNLNNFTNSLQEMVQGFSELTQKVISDAGKIAQEATEISRKIIQDTSQISGELLEPSFQVLNDINGLGNQVTESIFEANDQIFNQFEIVPENSKVI